MNNKLEEDLKEIKKIQLHKLPEKDRISYVKERIDTFPNHNQFAIGMSKDALLMCASKSILNSLDLYTKFMQSNIGEFRIYHTAMGTLIISQIDAIEGINLQTLRTATISQFHSATQRHYLKDKQGYVNKTYNRVFSELLEGQIITVGEGSDRSKKVYLQDPSPENYISLMYGKTLYHPVGKSSWIRAFLTGFTTHHRGIEPSTIYEFSHSLHGEDLIKKGDSDKFLSIHGPSGTGFVVYDIKGGLWRCYDRVNNPQAIVLREYSTEDRDAVNLAMQYISLMPFISITTLGKLMREDIIRILMGIARHKANSLLIEFSNSFVEARHVMALKLSQENFIDSDMVIKAQGLWETIVMNHDNTPLIDIISILSDVLVNIAEQTTITNNDKIRHVIINYLISIGYLIEEHGKYILIAEHVGLYLRFLRFVGVRL